MEKEEYLFMMERLEVKIEKCLKELVKISDKKSKVRWLTPESLEEEYDFKEATMSKYRMKRKIPFYKIGSKFIKYDREEINQWIEKQKVVSR